MKNFRNQNKIIAKTIEIEDIGQNILWLVCALPVLSMFAISYFMHPALQ